MNTITFNDSTKKLVLNIFGKDVDDDGYIVEKETGKRVVTPAGSEVHLREFAGIRKGSEIFITKDLPSLIQYATDIED